jgi:molecular chaperone GrpE
MREFQDGTEEAQGEDNEAVIPIVEEGASTESTGLPAADEVQAFRDRWLRAAAELENLRKRTARDLEAARARDRESMLRSFLEVLDSLERALDTHGAESNPWLEGLEGIQQQMLDVLKHWGATPYDSVGETFDPHQHEAVATVSLAGRAPGEIVDVTRVGYAMSNGTILRPAQVIVAQ